MVERYFDAFLHLTNWGTRQIMIRLPARLLDPATAQQYCTTDSAMAWAKDGNVILHLTRESDEGDRIEEDGEGRLASIISARADLATGDLRLLYLAWLHSVGAGELDDEQVEPPVPANLATLNAPLRSLIDFIRLDEDLMASQPNRRFSPFQWIELALYLGFSALLAAVGLWRIQHRVS